MVHANHPRELTPAMRERSARLVRAGIPVLSQTVLLRGVNDDAAVLEALFRGLVAMRVKPYYLHHPDLAPRHRRISDSDRRGPAAGRGLRGRVSGLCQPTYVLDIPGGYGKVPVAASAAAPGAAGELDYYGPGGAEHLYPPARRRMIRGRVEQAGLPSARDGPTRSRHAQRNRGNSGLISAHGTRDLVQF